MKIVRFGFSLFGINTYLVYDEKSRECAIIDPGMIDSEEEEALSGYIKQNNLKVTHLINTHLHIDHAIGDKYVSDAYGVTPEAHNADLPLGKRLQDHAKQFGMMTRVADLDKTISLSDEDIIRIGEGELRVLHVPGHSPGGIALYDAADGFVIVGDSLFSGSIGRTDLPGGDYATLIKAVKEQLLTLPLETVVYPGHGPATTIGEEISSNPFLK